MINSDAAFKIEKDRFPRAAFSLINLFDSDLITPLVADCMDTELQLRRESVSEEGQHSRYVFSVGGSIFKEYKKLYRKYPNIEHYRLSPVIDDSHFDIIPPDTVDDDEEFQILSLFQEHELADLKEDSVVMKAMNAVANLWHETKKSPLKWKILGVPTRCESTLRDRMKPHSHLRIVPARMPSAAHLNDELSRSNLVLIPPSSVHYANLTLAAVSAAIPFIVPENSQSHHLIEEHIPDCEESVVNMSNCEILRKGICRFLFKYETALERARDIKRKVIERMVNQKLMNINTDFISVVKEDSNKTQDRIVNEGILEQENCERDPCTVKLKVRVSGVVPEKGRTVVEVERGFYESDEVKEMTDEVRPSLDDQHNEMKVKDVGRGSISYTMTCQSLDALECLMGQYENGKLQDLMEDKFLSDELLDKIGAFYLAIDVTIDYEEYFLCRKELIQKFGSSMQKRDTAKFQTTEPQRTENTFQRVNKARDFLKAFERAGDKVTQSQIYILDQFLKEREQRRQRGHQQSSQDNSTRNSLQTQLPDDFEFVEIADVDLLTEIAEKNEELEAAISKLTIRSGIIRSQNRDRSRGRDIGKSVAVEGDRAKERELNPLFSEFIQAKSETRELATNHPELVMKTEKLSAYADQMVGGADIPEEAKEVYLDVRGVEGGYPVKGSVLEVFGSGSMPGQFNLARGIYIKKNGQWVICDWENHRVQVIDPIKLCCDLILQFHAFPKSFNPWNVTVDEDNDQYFMSDTGNGQVVVSSGQSKILNCFGRKEGIDPNGICLSPDGFIFIGDWNGYVRKYNKSGEHIARTEEGQVSKPLDLIVNKKCIFVSDFDRKCVHVLNHQMQSIRDIGKGHLERPYGLCFDHQQDGIYVCDVIGNRVVHFNCDGEFLSYKGQGQLEDPRYIALCKDNPYRLVVTQDYSNCVKLLYI
ncbi:uncharacterized protein [Ptychodera flava]|uniref:uncharacterized protein isoform X2 n=1 Tax=Ptychodera flava TaxID=63121 RepID=UPI00396A9F32